MPLKSLERVWTNLLILSIIGGISQTIFEIAGHDVPRLFSFSYSIFSLIWLSRLLLSVLKNENRYDTEFYGIEESNLGDEDW